MEWKAMEIERLNDLLIKQASVIEKITAERDATKVDAERLKAALQSIANNTCCDQCQEAALVAKAALDAAREE